MATETDRLEALKSRMSDTQRKDMAELLSNELKARESQKQTQQYQAAARSRSSVRESRLSSSLQTDEIKDVYSQVRKTLKGNKAKPKSNLASQITVTNMKGNTHQSAAIQNEQPRRVRPPLKSLALLGGILILAALKVFIETGVVKASSEHSVAKAAQNGAALENNSGQVKSATPSAQGGEVPLAGTKLEEQSVVSAKNYPITTSRNWSVEEKQILTELDSRRVDLEKRREAIEKREQAVQVQERELAGRLVELRSLSRKIGDFNTERDQRHEARLEQLANVYGSMAPNEAAPLVAKLDEPLALNLLQRLPGKRMGQILSMMDSGRAVELTKRLTEIRTND